MLINKQWSMSMRETWLKHMSSATMALISPWNIQPSTAVSGQLAMSPTSKRNQAGETTITTITRVSICSQCTMRWTIVACTITIKLVKKHKRRMV